MKKNKRGKFLSKINWKKTLFWTPRILALLYIIFITIFVLDSKNFVELIINLIPTLILIGILILALKKPKAGGVVFFALGIIFTIFFNTYRTLPTFLTISLPLFLIGILFFISKIPRRK